MFRTLFHSLAFFIETALFVLFWAMIFSGWYSESEDYYKEKEKKDELKDAISKL